MIMMARTWLHPFALLRPPLSLPLSWTWTWHSVSSVRASATMLLQPSPLARCDVPFSKSGRRRAGQPASHQASQWQHHLVASYAHSCSLANLLVDVLFRSTVRFNKRPDSHPLFLAAAETIEPLGGKAAGLLRAARKTGTNTNKHTLWPVPVRVLCYANSIYAHIGLHHQFALALKPNQLTPIDFCLAHFHPLRFRPKTTHKPPTNLPARQPAPLGKLVHVF